MAQRELLEGVLRRRFFYAPSFDIYGGVSGLYDYGPPGCALQANIVDAWRKHFVLEEDMLEVDCTALTPHEVLKTSGHVEKFADWMCRDLATGEIFRADHLVEEVLEARLKGDQEARAKESGTTVTAAQTEADEDDKKKNRKKKVKEIKAVKLDDATVAEYENVLAQIDGFSGPQLGELITKYKIVNPATGGPLDAPREFNLMFETAIGPSGQLKGYLRPETAQGQFLNFAKLLEHNNLKMPFASASIGKSFRNEISPRAGLLRVREFLMAEIEHFVDPTDKKHEKFSEIEHIRLRFWPKHVQNEGKTDLVELSIGEAVAQKVVDNETLGYFLARIYLFMMKIGVDASRMRFRQHMQNEMAHYAADCWDCELQTSYGWIECVGCADRSAYDLSVHAARTNEKLVVRETLETPVTIEEYAVDIQKKKLGPLYRKDAGTVSTWLESRTQCEREDLAAELAKNGKISVKIDGVTGTGENGAVEIGSDLIAIEKKKRVEHIREYTPNVIEPSFGIGRILYSLMEHSFYTRENDIARGVLSFPPLVAPTKVLVVPLSGNKEFNPAVNSVISALKKKSIACKVDNSSASIGKRYARNDELGTPFGVTVDFQTIQDGTITIRERDSMKQVRGSLEKVVEALQQMCDGELWKNATKDLAPFESQAE